MSYVVKPAPEDGKQEIHITIIGDVVSMHVKGLSREGTATVLFNALSSLMDDTDLTEDVKGILASIGGKE